MSPSKNQKQRNVTLTWLRRLLTFILVVAVVTILVAACGVLWLRNAMRAQLPQMDGELHVATLQSAVTVRRDEHAIPHIDASNMDDLIFAQGYITAQDRLWQMDITRRYAAGDLAEIFGNSIFGTQPLEHDRLQRVLQFRKTAERIAAAMPADERRYFDDYARGVNAFRSDRGHAVPAEFRILRYRPRPWTTVDSVLVGMSLAQMLDEQWPTKLARAQVEGALVAKLGSTQAASLIADLYPTGSWRDHPPMQPLADFSQPPEHTGQVPLDESQTLLKNLLRLRTVEGKSACLACIPGSNEWAVSGKHTASGKPLLSNDMHLQHQLPDIWYEADLHATSPTVEFHAAGVTAPGLPFIAAGHNAHIAWGFTALYGDTQDLYVERVNAQHQYWANDAWHPMTVDHETIPVRWGRSEVLDVSITNHGPIVNPALPDEKEPVLGVPSQQALALKWTVYDPGLNSLPLFELDSASNWSDFQNAASLWCFPTLNVAYSDDQGHIGYQAVGKMPFRPGGLAPVPIMDANHEWQGYIPFTALPSVEDPESGIVATANSRITPDGYPYPLTLEWASPYRNERIWKSLAAKDHLTPADMLALQTDIYSSLDKALSQRFAYAIDHAASSSNRLRQAADILRNWNGQVVTDTPAAAIIATAKQAWWQLVLEPKLGATWKLYEWPESSFVQEQLITNPAAAWLPPGYSKWDDLLAAAVSKGLDAAGAPADLKQWQYGTAHVLEVDHPLYGKLPFFGGLGGFGAGSVGVETNIGPIAQSGNGSTVKQVGRSFGPSQRFTMDWSDVDSSTENIFSGESGDPISKYYLDQWPYWYSGKTFPLAFSKPAVLAQTKHTLVLKP